MAIRVVSRSEVLPLILTIFLKFLIKPNKNQHDKKFVYYVWYQKVNKLCVQLGNS